MKTEPSTLTLPVRAQRRARRLLRAALGAALGTALLATLLWSGSAALAQQSARFSLGCWAITSGGGDQRQSANFRVRDAVVFAGDSMQATQTGIRANHHALLAALRPSGPEAPQPPLVNTTVLYLPLVHDQSLVLRNLCR